MFIIWHLLLILYKTHPAPVLLSVVVVVGAVAGVAGLVPGLHVAALTVLLVQFQRL